MTADLTERLVVRKSGKLYYSDDACKIIPYPVNAEKFEFYTGGTTSEKKCVIKTRENFINEGQDIYEALKLEDGLEFITTTTYEHVFGVSFHLMLPMSRGYIINLDRINYPEDLTVENAVLITTPAFLEAMRKYKAVPPVSPRIIITAGAKLENETFKYAQSISKRVIDVYGSTETGVIAYRENMRKMQLFKGIEILETSADGTTISTKYSEQEIQKIGDSIKQSGNKIEFLGRSDRILKINDKRISADELEDKIKKSELIKDCYCFERSGRLAVLAVLTDKGVKFAVKKGKPELTKNIGTHAKWWKFIDEIPKTKTGKIDKKTINQIFNMNLSMPLVVSRNCTKDYAEIQLCFLRSSNFFQGHFKSFPILPGVVQLFYANMFAKNVFKTDCRCGQIRKIKFANIIRPDKILNLVLQKTASGVNFKYEDSSAVYSSGILPLKSFLKEQA